MSQQLKSLIRDERGQGMTEYILIVVLVAIAAIAAFTFFRDRLRSKTCSTASTVYSAQ